MSRIFNDFKEAVEEIRRDLKEMGILVKTKTYQDKDISDREDMETFELQNYMYTVTSPIPTDLNPTQPWADHEFEERIAGYSINPGTAWRDRKDVWEEFLRAGKFDYTYSERINKMPASNQVEMIKRAILRDPMTRQAFMGIWNSFLDSQRLGGEFRIPCTIGYQFQVRGGALNVTYLQRSSDFATHFHNDLYLAYRMQQHIATLTGFPVGNFTHWIGSLHVFKKDVKEVF